ncbi:MAG TPA: cob(I)yrinic acid a,c-diamide adenosyltransferase [Polyangiales bacterium]|jgi:cob(I)alamin adenosyltransferase|nr:cob(I)yrinic acid a,c-diamide adenosyltransferase [Polyangiales bacterium]
MSDEQELTDEELAKNEAHRLEMIELKKKHDAEVRSKRDKKGLLIVNTGDGKGKSTAGFGLAMRAAGHGYKVAVVQFTKGSWKTGEGLAFKRFPEIDHFIVGDGFTWDTQNRQEDMRRAREGFTLVQKLIEECRVPEGEAREPKYKLIVLDELNIITRYEYLPIDLVVETIANRPSDLHMCVTGRDAAPELLAIADTVTEMRVVKHAYASGIKAQRGIEF